MQQKGNRNRLKQASNSRAKDQNISEAASETDLKETDCCQPIQRRFFNVVWSLFQHCPEPLFQRSFRAMKWRMTELWKSTLVVDSLSVLFQSSFIVFSGPFQDCFCFQSVSFSISISVSCQLYERFNTRNNLNFWHTVTDTLKARVQLK